MAEHQGSLTLAAVFLIWAGWLLYRRSPLYRDYYS
jgi:hypothetical protein